MNVYVNLRDELIVLETEKIAYVKANSNYSEVFFIKGGKRTLTMTLSKIEMLIRTLCTDTESVFFVRIGKSLLINQRYMVHIDVLKQQLLLDDYDGHSHLLSVSKPLLKRYKRDFLQRLDLDERQ